MNNYAHHAASQTGFRFTDLFVQRPVLSIVITLTLALAGIFAARSLPVLQFPRIESSMLEITTTHVGASAQQVQGFITEPVERAAATIPGVDYVDSITRAGISSVRVWLKLNEDSTAALAELTARLQQIRNELPVDAEDPAVQVNRADQQGAGFYLDVPINAPYSRADITDYLLRHVNPQLAAIDGVQRIAVEGGRLPAMRIWLDPARMAALDVGVNEIEQTLTANNLIATPGRSENSQQRLDLLASTTLSSVQDFAALIVRDVDGAQIRLRDVARVELGESEGDVYARLNNQDAVFISVWPLPGANQIAIADALYRQLETINASLPAGMKIGVGYDITRYMRSALREIFITLAETVVLVGIVVVLMMGSLRKALVPLVAIPVSLLGAVAVMWLLGFSLNLLTVLAIVLAVGLVVDDAIVVVENVARHVREGQSPFAAALISSRQLLAPVTGMTLTLAAVYLPIGFLSGLTGALFREFAITLAVAVLISGLVALTLSPIMSAWVCRASSRASSGAPADALGQIARSERRANAAFDRLQFFYARCLQRSVHWQSQILFAALLFSALAIPFHLFSQQELAPVEDQGAINVEVEAPPGASLAYTHARMDTVVDTLKTLPGTVKMWQIVTPQGGFGGQVLPDASQREQSVQELLPQTYGMLGSISGLRVYPFLMPPLPTAGYTDVEIVVRAAVSPAELEAVAQQLLAAARQSHRFLFVDTDLKIDLPQAHLQLDRERIADLGLNLEDVNRQLSLLLSGNYLNRFDLNGKAYQVIPMLDPRPTGTHSTGTQYSADLHSLLQLQLRTPAGDWIPLSAIARVETRVAPRLLSQFQQVNAFRIYAAVIPGSTKEDGLAYFEQLAQATLPPGYSLDYAGESRQLRQQGNTLTTVLLVSLLVVFLLLAVQFNSFRDPLIVLAGSVPLAIAGALLFTFLGWTSLNIYSQVGFITLVGLITRNGILMVEFANQLQASGCDKLTAICQAAATRLRPVLMTTGATVLGHFPLVLVSGAGAEARNSIGIILVAGMSLGTLFTLFVLPQVYLMLARETATSAAPYPATDAVLTAESNPPAQSNQTTAASPAPEPSPC